ncbi:cytochrome b/b6 domain-containing protein [Hymenobacter sp. BT664]|uniref:Cytochrome b/b6 domain-containing protein n=1 Tax=Hymenobacter montanus TaxID=2771359 RepID=A0A927BGW5_9BACT|nr:cytochrome b/b6 domain-containing protein [Hymenobacter montanus]MBD2769829.1 cytochrome b/b6 domain-containing protein [Hymenobacter montanus]
MNPAAASTTEAPTHDYTAPLRVWHWGNTLLVSGQLLTILFLKVIVDARSAVPEFLKSLGHENVKLTVKQANAFAHIISERIWQWHIYIGLTLAAFWLLRVGLELRGPSELRFTARLREVARRYRLAPAADKGRMGKSLFIKSSYALFYLALTIIAITGLGLTWADDVPFLGELEHTLKEIHNVTMYFIIAFFAVHVVGVVWAEITTDHGLISRMVGGAARETRSF